MEWQMVGHLNMATEHCLKSKTIIDGMEVYRETVTHMNKKTGNPGKSKNYYYIETSSKIYKTLEELLENIKEVTR